MKFSVGLPKICDSFLGHITENAPHIYEVYFSWGDFPSGRSSQTESQEYTEWEMIDKQREALKAISDAGYEVK